jgi:glutathione S-transferase
MITLHHLNNSRSQRILWLLEELNLPYDVKLYQRDPKTNLAPASLKAIHPLGKSPAVTNGEVTVAESGAIIEYLISLTDNDLRPELSSDTYREYSYWMHFAEGTLMTQLLIKMMFEKVKTSPMPFFFKPIAKAIANKAIGAYAGPNVESNLDYIEKHLQQTEWFCGNQLTAADIQMSFPLEAVITRQGGDKYPAIAEYVKKFQKRPAYQKALAAGGPYDYA